MAREFGHCRGCGAEIEWAKLNGKAHPFDPEPSAKGGYELVELSSEDRTVAAYIHPSKRRPGQRLVVSHFATCPKAADFRKE